MNVNIETPDILYISSGILTAAAVLTFISGGSTLSPITRLAVMATIFTFLLGLGIFVNRKLHQGIVFGLAATTYLLGTGYALSNLGLNSETGFIAFITSAAVFAGLGQLITNQKIKLTKKQLELITFTLLILGISITAFDVTGTKTTYTLNLQEEVNLTSTERSKVGKLIIQNGFILPREINQPRYKACIYPEIQSEARIDVDLSYRTGLIPGSSVQEEDVKIYMMPSYRESEGKPQSLGSYKLETADKCPESSNEKKIVFTRTEEKLY